MLRLFIKGILFPVSVILAVMEKVFSVAGNLSGIVFRLIAGIFILTAILSCGFGLEPWSVAVRMIIGGVVFLAIPFVVSVLAAGIAILNALIRTI